MKHVSGRVTGASEMLHTQVDVLLSNAIIWSGMTGSKL